MKKVLLFNIIIILASSFYINEFILTEDVFYQSFDEQLSGDQIESVLDMAEKMAWVDYTLSVIGYLLKIIVISALVYLVLVLNEIDATYSNTMAIVANSFSIFLIPIVIKVVILPFSVDTMTLDQIQYFSVGSLLNLFDTTDMENWVKVILRSINIWEVIFSFVLATQLKEYFNNNFKKSVQNVVLSYGSGLMVWTLFTVFIAITFS